jgi:uncharacterized protein
VRPARFFTIEPEHLEMVQRILGSLLIALFLLAACNRDDASESNPEPTPTPPVAEETATATPSPSPSPTPEPTATTTPTPEPSPTQTPQPTATPDPTPAPVVTPESVGNPETEPVAWYIEAIAEKEYDGCCLERLNVYEEGSNYTAWVIAYQGDGLRLTGLMAVPHGEGPFPVAIFNHGYFPFDEYDTGYDTLREVRYMAQAGYLTLAPDYRNYAGSDEGDYIFEPGYVHDVRNLIEALKDVAEADSERIGMSGHSMGGGITLQNIVSGADVKAAVLYGTVTAFEDERYQARIQRWSDSGGTGSNRAIEFSDRYGTPDDVPEIYARMSAGNYFDQIEVPVLIHHGDADPTTPIEWAYAIEQGLRDAGIAVEMHVYAGAGHSFQGYYFELMMQRTLEFFDQHVRDS